MGKLTFILGGARSGKSDYAEQIGRESGKSVLFIATATAFDDEMRERIHHHRTARPHEWQTLEVPMNVGAALLTEKFKAEVVIVDCITLLASNILIALPEDSSFEMAMQKVKDEIDSLLAAQEKIGGEWLIVSNEVGLGLVPLYPLGRIYRDVLGRANQMLARAAQRVIFMVAGIPTVIK
ncbi:MAG: bifunctional adenosylcobinamide kinase/adenosylcobinamide-phosphate guanylyltransferase [Anaerolineales bacterium]|nr:bifunctional adenosylcobinamide kinase/adenosylcobinamide-phosphate guanylyltransferase [Anaerolineales bacterium]